MLSLTAKVTDKPVGFLNDDARWEALRRRDRAADGAFYYSVRSTGVYCRPSCPARLARRENVAFHLTCEDAECAGFRPCKRCRPNEAGLVERHAAAVAKACALIEEADEMLGLAVLADAAGPVHHRPVRGTRGSYRVNMRHGVSRLHSGRRHTLGIIFHDAK